MSGYGKRDTWTVPVDAVRLLAAASEREQYHEQRLAWWQAQFTAARADLSETGLSIRDMPVSSGFRADVMLDPQKSARLTECQAKVREHETAITDYQRYQRMFDGAPAGATFDLTVHDFEFFGL